jgi:hypothetical protein
VIAVFFGRPADAVADGGPFGLGIILGEPSGLSAKLFLDARHALDFALDYSLVDSALYIHADYLLHFSGWRVRDGGVHRLVPYVGLGGKVGLRDHDDGRGHDRDGALGARIPLGIAWMPASVPIDVFLELVPGLFLIPETDPDLDASLGLRYFF